jgi:hypothetical protein
MCEKSFSQVHAYWCKKCSHTLSNAPSELTACCDDLAAATSAVADVARSASFAEKSVRKVGKKDVETSLGKTSAALAAAKERIALRKERTLDMRALLEKERAATARENERIRALEKDLTMREAAGFASADALRDRKVELVTQLFGLLPVFPTIESTIRIVNFAVPSEEAYHSMDADEAAAVASYFVKITSLMGLYLEARKKKLWFALVFLYFCCLLDLFAERNWKGISSVDNPTSRSGAESYFAASKVLRCRKLQDGAKVAAAKRGPAVLRSGHFRSQRTRARNGPKLVSSGFVSLFEQAGGTWK